MADDGLKKRVYSSENNTSMLLKISTKYCEATDRPISKKNLKSPVSQIFKAKSHKCDTVRFYVAAHV